jgi:hypothetical protein
MRNVVRTHRPLPRVLRDCHGFAASGTAIAPILLAVIAVLAVRADAQPVAIDRGAGQGLLFQHRGNCYAIMPHHVTEPGVSDVSLDVGTTRKGEGTIVQDFTPFDLSLATVRRRFAANCQLTLDDLPTSIEPILERREPLRMVRVSNGEIEEAGVELERLDFSTLTARLGPGASRLLKGNSGAMIFSGASPIAMAVQADGDARLIALRTDAIVGYIGRFLDGRPQAEAATAPSPEPVADGLAYSLVACSLEPLRPDRSCLSMSRGAGPAIFPPGDERLVIDLDISTPHGAPQRVRGVELRSAAGGSSETRPRKIVVTISPSGEERALYRPFADQDMPADEDFVATRPGAVAGRTLRIVVMDRWDPDLPLRIDGIALR